MYNNNIEVERNFSIVHILLLYKENVKKNFEDAYFIFFHAFCKTLEYLTFIYINSGNFKWDHIYSPCAKHACLLI